MTDLQREKGTYALLLYLAEETWFPRVRALGRIWLPRGVYVYLGSAHGSGGVGARVAHHLGYHANNPIWHLDAVRPSTTVLEVWATYDPVKRECEWSRRVRHDLGGEVLVAGFGSGDCDYCEAHFYRFPRLPSFDAFRRISLRSTPGHAPLVRVQIAPAPAAVLPPMCRAWTPPRTTPAATPRRRRPRSPEPLLELWPRRRRRT